MIFDLPEKKIYTVSELTRNIKAVLENSIGTVWVEGEVSNLRLPSSGHMYFTLKDAESQIRGVMFRYSNRRLRFKLEDGLKVIARGAVGVYEKRGEYQIIVEELEPRGLGALQLAFEQLKRRLEQEGLFVAEHKKPLPFLPSRIGVVTSPTGAAIRDILHVIERRFSKVHIIINPVRVQGAEAPAEIARAINEFNQLKNVDVLIIGRGGGSIEDLWAFNEEVVARSIYHSHIPVISAVGHEIDYVISDFVADLRAPTPSAAAELVVAERDELLRKIDSYSNRFVTGLANYLQLCQERLQALKQRYTFRQLENKIMEGQQRVDDLVDKIHLRLEYFIELRCRELKLLAEKLGALSPFAVLGRGYSLAFKLPGKKLLKSIKQIRIGDKVEVKLAEGSFVSEVEQIS